MTGSFISPLTTILSSLQINLDSRGHSRNWGTVRSQNQEFSKAAPPSLWRETGYVTSRYLMQYKTKHNQITDSAQHQVEHFLLQKWLCCQHFTLIHTVCFSCWHCRLSFQLWSLWEDSSSNLCIQTGSGARPASYTMGTGGSFPGGKAWLGHDADHLPSSSAEVKKE
jgi:hypothetical protein